MAHSSDPARQTAQPDTSPTLNGLPDRLLTHICRYLPGPQLAKARELSRRWNALASAETLWKSLCLDRSPALETDPHLWPLIDADVVSGAPACWRRLYPPLSALPGQPCRLEKTQNFLCNVKLLRIRGGEDMPYSVPETVVVERRFNILQLSTFVMPNAGVFYVEPAEEGDREEFRRFVEYLLCRDRAGLAVHNENRLIFVPPCSYSEEQQHYHGSNLLCIHQKAYPPLAP